MTGGATPARRLPVRPSVAELADVWRAQLALIRALLRVRRQAVGTLVATLPSPARADGPSQRPAVASGSRRRTVARLELAVARASRRGLFTPTCLVRSLALVELLNDNGLTGAEIRLGVRTDAVGDHPGALQAHAWVELDGRAIGDPTMQLRRFTPLGGVRPVKTGETGQR